MQPMHKFCHDVRKIVFPLRAKLILLVVLPPDLALPPFATHVAPSLLQTIYFSSLEGLQYRKQESQIANYLVLLKSARLTASKNIESLHITLSAIETEMTGREMHPAGRDF